MKNLLALATVASALACSAANAARVVVDPPVSPTGVYSIYLHGETTTFNGVGLSVKPDNAAMPFLDVNSGNLPGGAGPRPAGDSFSYRNRNLDADPSEFPDSLEWTLLGVLNTAQEIAFSGGPLGSTIDTSTMPGGRLFLANVKLSPGATATWNVQLVNGVETVYQEDGPIPVPEPAAIGMASLALLGLAFRRRLA
jgi:hypothetical protein